MRLREYRMDNQSLVEKLLSRELEKYPEYADLMPNAWREMEELGKWHRFASIRVSFLNCIAATYAFRREKVFTESCQCFLKFSVARSIAHAATRTRLGKDLSIAISLGWQNDARFIAGKVMSSTRDEEQSPDALVALILAALTDLNYTVAGQSSEELMRACIAKQFTKQECERYTAWSGAAAALTRRDTAELMNHLTSIEAHLYRDTQKELGRREAGKPSELMASDFWDYQTTALVAIATDFGLIDPDNRTLPSPFFDNVWTRECGHGLDR